MTKPKIMEIVPVLGIGSYDEAVAHYVDWLGFDLDREWREEVVDAIGRPLGRPMDILGKFSEYEQATRT
ncbi:MAG: hypothetical protein QGD92_06575 [Gammaproteobacteria bacterium]|nr:hypothetical protein [Gammaproteobacteria bacterium]